MLVLWLKKSTSSKYQSLSKNFQEINLPFYIKELKVIHLQNDALVF